MPSLPLLRAAAMMLLFSASAVAEDNVPATGHVPAGEVQPGTAPVWLPEAVQAPIAASGIGDPVPAERLADMRGGADIIETTIDVDGTVDDNTASDVITGSNTITGGSFANAAGLNTVIQNSGANVLIQNATSVQIEFAGPTP